MQEHNWQPLLSTTFPCSHHRLHITSGHSVTQWPQVSAQLLWNHGCSHLCEFSSHHVLGFMSWQGAGAGAGGVGGGFAASHWPQVIAQLVWNQGRRHLYFDVLCVFFLHHVVLVTSSHGGCGGRGGEGGSASHWPQVCAQLL